jgi:hypothetical protein
MQKGQTLQHYFDIVLMCDIISQCRKMPFRQKYDLIGLGEYCKKIIENEIGPEIKPLLERDVAVREKILHEFEVDVRNYMAENMDFKEESVRKMKWPAVALKITDNEELKDSQEKRKELLKTPCSEKIDPVEIPCIEYDEKLEEGGKTAEFMGVGMTMDGMSALVRLISKGVVALAKPKPEEESKSE